MIPFIVATGASMLALVVMGLVIKAVTIAAIDKANGNGKILTAMRYSGMVAVMATPYIVAVKTSGTVAQQGGFAFAQLTAMFQAAVAVGIACAVLVFLVAVVGYKQESMDAQDWADDMYRRRTGQEPPRKTAVTHAEMREERSVAHHALKLQRALVQAGCSAQLAQALTGSSWDEKQWAHVAANAASVERDCGTGAAILGYSVAHDPERFAELACAAYGAALTSGAPAKELLVEAINLQAGPQDVADAALSMAKNGVSARTALKYPENLL